MRIRVGIVPQLWQVVVLVLTVGCMVPQAAPVVPANPAATTIVVVRHAERSTDDPRDPSLSPAGQDRARALSAVLSDARVTDIYTTQYKRTRQTAEPYAQQSGITIVERPISAANSATYARDLAREILTRSAGRSVLVVGHSNTVPDIVGALSGTAIPAMTEAEYDHIFVVVIPASGSPRVMQLRFGNACCVAPGQPMPATTDEAQVRAAMAAFLDALNALDVQRMDVAFADDVTAFVPTAQAGEAVGRAAVTGIFRSFAEQTRKTTSRLGLVPESERVIASPSLGVVTFQTHGAAPAVTRRRTFVFRHVGDRWLISHFHASDIKVQSD